MSTLASQLLGSSWLIYLPIIIGPENRDISSSQLVAQLYPSNLTVPYSYMKMGSSETFCLRWNEFEGKVSRSFSNIRSNNQFFDCTLTTDDDKAFSDNLRAHKVILSACSEFFRNILTKESMCAHPNPLIYLSGISAQELKYVLDFMYHGEVNVAKYELDKFLEVAETLKIKGLTKSSEGSIANDQEGTLPSFSPEKPCKNTKVLPATTQSTAINTMEFKIGVKTECDPLIPIGGLEESTRCSDGEGSNDEDFENDFEGEYGGSDENNDLQDAENLQDKGLTRSSSSKTGAKKRLSSAISPSPSIGEPPKKIKAHYSATPSQRTAYAADTKCGTFVGTGSDVFEEGVEGNRDFDSRDKDNKENIEDEYDVDDDAVGESGDSGSNPKGYNHMTETERVTLVNLIKTLDKDQLLMGHGGKSRSTEAREKRKVLWIKLVSSFNEICGLDYDKGKVNAALNRIKRTPKWKAHSLLLEDF